MRLFQTAILSVGLALGGALVAEDRLPDGLYAEFTTPRGIFVAELYYARAPLTVTNFVGLAEGTLGPKPGTPYYAGLKWYPRRPRVRHPERQPAGAGGQRCRVFLSG